MATPAEHVATIESTLSQLYAKLHKTLTQKDRSATLQDISVLEKSLDRWTKQAAIASGTKARTSTIDLTGF